MWSREGRQSRKKSQERLREPTASPEEARTECWAGHTGMAGHCGRGSYPGCTADQRQAAGPVPILSPLWLHGSPFLPTFITFPLAVDGTGGTGGGTPFPGH